MSPPSWCHWQGSDHPACLGTGAHWGGTMLAPNSHRDMPFICTICELHRTGYVLSQFPYSNCCKIKVEITYSLGVLYHKGYGNLQTLEKHRSVCEKTFLFLELQTATDLGRCILLIIHTTSWDKGKEERKHLHLWVHLERETCYLPGILNLCHVQEPIIAPKNQDLHKTCMWETSWTFNLEEFVFPGKGDSAFAFLPTVQLQKAMEVWDLSCQGSTGMNRKQETSFKMKMIRKGWFET